MSGNLVVQYMLAFSGLFLLWLALRHGSVTIPFIQVCPRHELWLALRHGSVTITRNSNELTRGLWLALRHGSVTILTKF